MKSSKSTLREFALVSTLAILILGATTAFAGTWAPPTATPTGGEPDAPIIVNGDQTKAGALIVNATKGDGTYAATGLDVPNGNVGIGTASPANPLSFGTSLFSNGGKLSLYEGSGGSNVYGFGITSGSLDMYSNGSQVMALKSTGNVGIGTASPNDKLEVNGNLRIDGVVTCIQGTCPQNNAIRLTPNLHLNAGAGYAVIANWDNGTTGNSQAFRVGNGAGTGDAFYVTANGDAVVGRNLCLGGSCRSSWPSTTYYTNYQSVNYSSGGNYYTVVSCNSGDVATGGGIDMSGGGSTIKKSQPGLFSPGSNATVTSWNGQSNNTYTSASPATGWYCEAANSGAECYVVCAH